MFFGSVSMAASKLVQCGRDPWDETRGNEEIDWFSSDEEFADLNDAAFQAAVKEAESSISGHDLSPPGSSRLRQLLRWTAFALAAAYYEVTYNPEIREDTGHWALFSFPWTVASVIESGLQADDCF